MTNQPQPPPEGDLPTGLARPAQRALAAAGVWRLEQLTEFSESRLRQLHGIGPQAIEQLRQAMRDRGLAFAAEPGGRGPAAGH